MATLVVSRVHRASRPTTALRPSVLRSTRRVTARRCVAIRCAPRACAASRHSRSVLFSVASRIAAQRGTSVLRVTASEGRFLTLPRVQIPLSNDSGILLRHRRDYPASVASQAPTVNADSSNSLLGGAPAASTYSRDHPGPSHALASDRRDKQQDTLDSRSRRRCRDRGLHPSRLRDRRWVATRAGSRRDKRDAGRGAD